MRVRTSLDHRRLPGAPVVDVFVQRPGVRVPHLQAIELVRTHVLAVVHSEQERRPRLAALIDHTRARRASALAGDNEADQIILVILENRLNSLLDPFAAAIWMEVHLTITAQCRA